MEWGQKVCPFLIFAFFSGSGLNKRGNRRFIIAGFLTSNIELNHLNKAHQNASHSAARTCGEHGAFGYSLKIYILRVKK